MRPGAGGIFDPAHYAERDEIKMGTRSRWGRDQESNSVVLLQ